MRAAADDGTAMLTPLTIVGVVTPAAGSIPVPAVRAASTTTNDRVAVARPVPPDPPPPRA